MDIYRDRLEWPTYIKYEMGNTMKTIQQMYQSLPEDEKAVLSDVAEALRMTPDQFLSDEVLGVTAEEARGYLKAFAVHASDAQIKMMYYLTKGLTEK